MTVNCETFVRKPWTDRDRRHLMVAYRSGASLKTMSDLFGRSTSAINKALTRYGARPLGSQPRGTRPKMVKRPITAKGVQARIDEFDAKLDKWVCEEQISCFSPEAIRAYEALQKTATQKQEEPQLSRWLSKKDFMAYLEQMEFPVKIKQVGYHECYCVSDRRPLTLSELLVFVNKVRIEDNKPPLYLENVTEG